MNTGAFIKLFKTNGSHYFYDVNKNSVVKTNKQVWDLLQSNSSYNEDTANEYEAIKTLKEYGFLSSNKVKEIVHPTDEIIEDYIQNKVEMITLQVTQQCNFRCEYCAYSGGYENRSHQQKTMTFELAKKGIDYLFAHSSERNEVSIGFYGGEPLLEYDLIHKSIEYINENISGKTVRYSITTNATLLTSEMVDFFNKNNVNLVISLDGPKEVHDKSRRFAGNNSGTFDKVIKNINMINYNFPDYFKQISINAVVNPLNDVTCVYDFFNNFDTIKELSVTSSEIADFYSKNEVSFNNRYYEQVEYEYFKLLLVELNELEEKYVSKLILRSLFDLESMYKYMKTTHKLPEKAHHAGPCIPGTQRLFLTADGDFFPCERVSETSPVSKLGNIENGLDVEKVKEVLNIGKLSEESCKNCWAIRFCNLCVASVDDGYNLSNELKGKRCIESRGRAENMLKDICTLKEFGYQFA